MRAAHNLATAFAPTQDEQPAADRQSTLGFADALGDRVTLFDDETKRSFEMLRFRPEFGDAPGFEHALRASVESVGALRGSSPTTAREVARLGEDAALALVSTHAEGKRLADLMPRARGAAFATELVHAIGPVLAGLHQSGQVHGALTPERIVVSLEGRPTLTEDVLGAAIATLALPADQLTSVVGIAVPDGHDSRSLDPRIDVIQLGFIVLSLLLGRRIPATEYPRLLVEWLDELSRTSPETATQFRPWLERALETGEGSFATAVGAMAAFDTMMKAPPDSVESVPKTRRSARVLEPMPVTHETATPLEPDAQQPASLRPSRWRWVTAALGLAVVAQAVVIGSLYVANLSTAATALVIARPSLPTPTALISAAPAVAELMATLSPDAPPGALPGIAANSAQVGGMTVTSAIDLQVFERGTLLGKTGSPIAIAAGTHVLDVVNEAFGYRARQTVEVEPGQMASVRVALPKGRVNINAAPWADVQIDGVAAGQTPLANVSLTIGEHEIIFTHPQFGEQRQTAIVTVDDIIRVTAVFRQ